MSNLRHYLTATLPGLKTSLEDVRYGDPVLAVATNSVAIGLFERADFDEDEVSVHVVRDKEDDVTYEATDTSADNISVYLLPHQMKLSDILIPRREIVVTHRLIGETCVFSVNDSELVRTVIGYVGYGYGENHDIRVALEYDSMSSDSPDTYALLDVIGSLDVQEYIR